MAASFWDSSCARNLVSRQRLQNANLEDRAKGLTEEHVSQIKAYFTNEIWELSRQCKLRYRVYVRHSFCSAERDPRLLYAACLYLASKAEESYLQAKHIVAYVKLTKPSWPYDMKHLLDAEMLLLQDLDYNLVTYSPYRPLTLFASDAKVPQALTQAAWAMLNDSFCYSDAILMYPPYLLALACLVLAAASMQQGVGDVAMLGPPATAGTPPPPPPAAPTPPAASTPGQPGHTGSIDLTPWLTGLNVDLGQVYDVVQEVAAAYERHRVLITADECNRLLDAVILPPGTPGPYGAT